MPISNDDLPLCPSPTRTEIFRPLNMHGFLSPETLSATAARLVSHNSSLPIWRAHQETISRIETGKHTASVKLVDKIDAVLRKAMAKRKKSR